MAALKNLSFVGKNVVITGAGGGLGRSYALEFARRGARVLVNDVGIGGKNVVDEINNNINSKVAILNNNSVLDGNLIIDQAINEFGSIDILINNAGILRDKSFIKMSPNEWKEVIDVHLNGTFSLTHSVWKHMIDRKFGRIINIGSGSGLYGNFGQSNYAAAKMGIIGLSTTLSKEGEKYNVLSNVVIPIAASNMTKNLLPPDMLMMLDPVHITPLVCALCHDSSKTNGQIFEAGGGWYSKIRLERSAGITLGSKDKPASAEDICDNINLISDFNRGETTHPESNTDALRAMMASAATIGLPEVAVKTTSVNATAANDNTNSSSSSNKNNNNNTLGKSIHFESDLIFTTFQKLISNKNQQALDVATKINAKFQLDLTKGDNKKSWLIDMQSLPPSVSLLADDAEKKRQDALIICSDETFVQLKNGTSSVEFAYMRGSIQVKGSIPIALRLKSLLELQI